MRRKHSRRVQSGREDERNKLGKASAQESVARDETADYIPMLASGMLSGAAPEPGNLSLRHRALLHLQHQQGNRQAQRVLQRSTAPAVQRETPFFSAGFLPANDPDMTEVRWDAAGRAFGAETEIGGNLAPLRMNLPTQAPFPPPRPRREPDWSRPPDCNPGHHRRPEPLIFDDPSSPFGMLARQDSWQAIRQVLSVTETGYNNLVPLNNNYYNAQRDVTLQSPEMGLSPFAANSGGDLSSLVGEQVVPRAGGQGRTIDSLFKPEEGGSQGTELNWGNRDDRAVDRATRSPRVEQAVLAAQAADASVNTAVDHVRTQAAEVETAANGVSLAESQLRLAEAENERERSQSELDRLTAEREAIKKNVKDLLGIVKGLTSLLTATSDAARVGPATDLIGIIADRVVDATYAERIGAARSRLQTAVENVQGSRLVVAGNQLAVAYSNLSAKLLALQEARNAVARPLIERRAAYNALAQIAAQESGGSPESRARISSAIAAIPLIEVVISRLDAMRSVLHSAVTMPYSRESGIGYGMAEYHGHADALSNFMYALGVIHGLNSQFTGMQQFWQQRLGATRAIVTRLSGLGAPQP